MSKEFINAKIISNSTLHPSYNHCTTETYPIAPLKYCSAHKQSALSKQTTMAENTPLNSNPEKNDINNEAQIKEIPLMKKLTAELIGTFILTFAILASVQNMILLGTNDFWLVCVTHGLVLGLVAFIYGPISGGHVNPAVSFAFLLKKQMSVVEFVTYVIAQCLGSFMASMLVSGLFHVNFTGNFLKLDEETEVFIGYEDITVRLKILVRLQNLVTF